MRSTRRQKRSWGRVKWVIALIVIAAGLVYAWNNLGLRGAMRGTTPEAGQMTAENVSMAENITGLFHCFLRLRISKSVKSRNIFSEILQSIVMGT